MCDTRAVFFNEPVLRDPVAFIGLPSVGLVGSILSGLMAREMKLPVIGGITSDEFPPYTFISNGRPCPQIRILAGTPARAKRKKPKDSGDGAQESPAEETVPRKRIPPRDIVVITSEFTPKPEQVADVVRTMIDVLDRLGVKDVVCLEGAAAVDASNDILAVAGNEVTRTQLKEADIKTMDDGLVRGVAGVMLLEGTLSELNVMTLMTPASTQLPDPRAAARLAEPVMKLYPRFKLDTSPLFKEAEVIDNQIQTQHSTQHETNNGFYG